ncbi:hypothetical protein ASPVEDRAFT_83397 [Aspergillus versicolor CBS 583.65]|uniref:Uncharacterized protein n=1 Tax=Aspergillus versicolor CBS 583.65 TaxID=1036611 RepID=A0A1L9PK68_ASPVE|nr:uncharacterized protein ASPVEDRAFT_83397 [Aspergillus versicolor CBS 583.65]OJJ01873.1 hypothetical protein ASPVEDRAFT_83397 [Aspergillus versicolor CBS 583.65]
MRSSTFISLVVALFAFVAFAFPTALKPGLRMRAQAAEPIIPSQSIYLMNLEDIEPLDQNL